MNDSTPYNFQGGAPKRKSKTPLLLLLIAAAVIIGLIIWRFKPGGGQSGTTTLSKDSVSITVPSSEISEPETIAAPAASTPVMAPAVPKPEEKKVAPTPEKPRIVAHERRGDLYITGSQKPVREEPKVEASIPTPKEPALMSSPVKKVEPKLPVVSKPAPRDLESKAASARQPGKFALEDQPMPEKSSLSEEGRLAMNTLPKAVESQSEAATSSAGASDTYNQALNAYHKQDYANAIRLFGQLPKPSSRQRGNPVRDQYVEGNFLLGLSLLRVDRASEAVNAFLAVLDYEKYYPMANMNIGICYVELKQYFKADKAFEAVVRDQGYIEPAVFDDVMQRTKYFWALAWTRMYKASSDRDKQAYYQQQAILRWKDYQTWFGKNEKYRSENRRAEDYIKTLSAL
jgi:tetratricopeptide (TPR) repeat protein